MAALDAPVASSSLSDNPAAERAIAASEAQGIPLRDVYVPTAPATPAEITASQSAGVISPLYTTPVAPTGLSELGLKEGLTGNLVPFSLNTTSVMGVYDPSGVLGPNATYLADSSPDGYSVQLNAVLTNVTLFNQTGYSFWTQNVLLYYPVAQELYLLTNVWNFSSPTAVINPQTFYNHGPLGTDQGIPYYYAETSVPFPVSYPFHTRLYMNSSVVGGRERVNFTVGIQPGGSGPWIFYPYDWVTFNSTATWAHGPHAHTVSAPAEYNANGYGYNAIGLPNDMEIALGGPGGGSNVDFTNANATLNLNYLVNGNYESVPSAYTFGDDTGETSTGATMSWEINSGGHPYGVMSTGPTLLGGLWNASTPVGAASIQMSVVPSNAFVFIAYGATSPFNQSGIYGWSPNVITNITTLPAGKYSFLIALSNYDPQYVNITIVLGYPIVFTIHLTADTSRGIYTPLQAWTNAQYQNISTQGNGTINNPYILVNDQTKPMAEMFGQLNDAGFPVFPGVFFARTSAYVEFNHPASMSANTSQYAAGSTNDLPYWFFGVSHVALMNASSISGWFSNATYYFPGFLTFDVTFWNSSNNLIGGNQFKTQADGLLLYGGTGNTVWGNTFSWTAPPAALAGQVVPQAQAMGLDEQDAGDLIYNNQFLSSLPTTAVSLGYNLYWGTFQNYLDRWNVTPRAASTVTHDVNFPRINLVGSIIGGTTVAGNAWWDYGYVSTPWQSDNPYAVPGSAGPAYYANDPAVCVWTSYCYAYGFGLYGIWDGGDYVPLTSSPLFHETFSPTGLIGTPSWSLTVTNATLGSRYVYYYNSTDPEPMIAWLTNGTFNAAAVAQGNYTPVHFSAHVAGAGTSTVTFHVAYQVEFLEGNLPSGVTWYVNATGGGNSYSNSSSGSSISLFLPNGTYRYAVSTNNPNWAASQLGGAFSVIAHSIGVPVLFNYAYKLSFGESGLAGGTSWTVQVNGANWTGVGTISGSAVNGTYTYAVIAVNGYTASPQQGTIAVTGAAATQTISFTSAATFTLTFSESGLPSSTLWNVTVNGVVWSGTTASLSNPATNGTYSYVVAASGYTASPASGIARVKGSTVTVAITFTAVTTTYAVTFTEAGLAASTTWTVNLGGTLGVNATGSSIVFHVAAGTYAYAITPKTGYTGVWDGSLTISAARTVATTFHVTSFTATFTETGATSGKTWQVLTNGTTTTGTAPATISATGLVNGTYTYVASSSTSGVVAISGSYSIAGAAASVSVPFAKTTYAVTFTESGLTSGTAWTVTLNGSIQSSTTTTITFQEPNGTSYAYQVTPILNWKAAPYSGTFAVSGATHAVSVAFSKVTFTVYFNETGLPSGTSWSITLNGSTSSTTASIAFHGLVNGTYAYSITGIAGYTTTWKGNATVGGLTKTVKVAFAKTTYSATFTESGLPSGTVWTVTFNGTTTGAIAPSSVVFSAANGTYSYSINGLSGWAASKWSGKVTVSGASTTNATTWSRVTYTVTFTTTGLPTGAGYSVTLNGTQSGTAPSSVSFASLSNGTYAWSATAVGYTLASPTNHNTTVGGASKTITLTFVPRAFAYTVSFTETGLPTGTSWTVWVNGVAWTGTTATISNTLNNGTYTYVVSPTANGFGPTPSSGALTVAGAPVSEAITFSAVVYSVSFTESGLGLGGSWWVTLAGTTLTSSAATITFSGLPNGTYAFSAGATGYSASPASGNAVVDGSPVTKSIALTLASYALSFDETGLSSGTSWSVWVNGVQWTGSTSSISSVVPNGNYNFAVPNVAGGWAATPSGGAVTVNGAAATVSITFSAVTYTVTFTESGLGLGGTWSVTLGGVTHGGGAGSLVFEEANASGLSYTVQASGYAASPASGTLSVSGAPVSQAVTLTGYYSLVFTATSLPTGAFWTVTLTCGATVTSLSSTGTTITFSVPAGSSCSYTLTGSGGYNPSPSTGTVTVSSSGKSISTGFAQTSTSSSSWSINTLGWILIALVIVFVILAAAALMMGRGKGGSKSSAAKADTSGTATKSTTDSDSSGGDSMA